MRYATALIALLPLACAHGGLSEDIAANAEWRRSMRIIDVHGHISPASVEKALAAMDAHFIDRLVNLTAGSTIEQFTAAKQAFEEKGRGRFILYINDVYGNQPIEDPEFGRKVTETLEQAAALGAKGLKISKSLGLYWKDKDKKIVPIDDPRLDPMWATAGRLGLPVSIHSGDPKAFWQPIDEKNERYEELHEHPDWAFGGGAYPPREEILRQLEAVVARHPKVTFVGVHFGNDPEDVDHVAALFRRYPNYNADLGRAPPGDRPPGSRQAAGDVHRVPGSHPVRHRLHGVPQRLHPGRRPGAHRRGRGDPVLRRPLALPRDQRPQDAAPDSHPGPLDHRRHRPAPRGAGEDLPEERRADHLEASDWGTDRRLTAESVASPDFPPLPSPRGRGEGKHSTG